MPSGTTHGMRRFTPTRMPIRATAEKDGALPFQEPAMLLTIALVLLVLWALGVFAFHVTAGVIHILLVLALIVGLVQLFTGRRTV